MGFAARRQQMIMITLCIGAAMCPSGPGHAAPTKSPSPKQQQRPAAPAEANRPAPRPKPTDETAPPTATSPSAGAKKLAPEPPIDTSKPPPLLPRASREQMRACAEEWDALKRKTKTGLPMWRDFATECLTR